MTNIDEWSEPMAGKCHPRGTMIHAVQEAPGPASFPGTVIRRSLCGVAANGALRQFHRPFDPFNGDGRKVCPKCIDRFIPWWAEQTARSVEDQR